MCRQIYEGLFPVQVYARVAWGMHEEVLFASERTYLRGAARQRREEFISVRACARDALRCLGLSRPPLIAHAIRGLQWPEGTTGSLTHTGQYRAAVVASSQDVTGIGIDAESALPLPEGLRDRILTPGECQIFRRTPALENSAWDRIIFSAKEAAYKAYAPATGRFLDFLDCELTTDLQGKDPLRIDSGRFGVVMKGRDRALINGAWIIANGLIHSAAWIMSGVTAASSMSPNC